MNNENDEFTTSGNADQDRQLTLHLLHNDEWTPTLLSAGVFQRVLYGGVLSKTERIIVELKVEGYPEADICTAMKIKRSTLKRHIYTIKNKYRNELDIRVDDWIRRENYKRGLNDEALQD